MATHRVTFHDNEGYSESIEFSVHYDDFVYQTAQFISDNYEYGEPLELAQWISFAISFDETEKIKVEFGYTDKYPVEITIEEV